MNKLITVAIALLAAFSASAAFAFSDVGDKTILRIGVQGKLAYVVTSPTLAVPNGTCLYNAVYVQDLSTAEGKGLYTQLLTAYTQGKPLKRIDYANYTTPGTICFLSLVEF